MTFKTAKKDFIIKYLKDLLRTTQSNMKQAAIAAGLERSQLYKMLRQFGIDPQPFRYGEIVGVALFNKKTKELVALPKPNRHHNVIKKNYSEHGRCSYGEDGWV